MAATRRKQRRESTLVEIKMTALDQISRGGRSALTVRGLTRAMNLSPAGLYRYYPSLDALVSELKREAYNGLADEIRNRMSSVTDGAGPKLVAGIKAYREWALDHRNEFLMVFGSPIPLPDDLAEGVHSANARIGEVFFEVAAKGFADGQIQTPGVQRSLTPLEESYANIWREGSPGFPTGLVPALLGAWGHFHGLVHLEVIGQLHWIYPDPGGFYAEETQRIVARLTGGG